MIELASGTRDLSARDIAKLFGEIVGRPVDVESAPPSAVVPAFTQFGISRQVAALYEEMYEGLIDKRIVWERSHTRFVRGNADVKGVLGSLLSGT